MRINSKALLLGLAWFLVVLFPRGVAQLHAATVEVEDQDDAVEDGSAANSEKAKKSSSDADIEKDTTSKMTAIDANIGFYYFLKSGYVVPDPSQIPSIGKVSPMNGNQMSYSVPNTLFLLLDPKFQKRAKAGDLLVVYHAGTLIQEPRSGFSDYWIKNLAVVKVLEVEQRRCLVQVTESFYPFVVGDKVRPLDDEIERWKEAQSKKSLPDHPVKCFVAGGQDPEIRHYWTVSDFVFLTAGSKKGIVEGQNFELLKTENRVNGDETLHVPIGRARVFFAGPNYSMAEILTSHLPIEAGFEANYEPAGEK